MDNSHNESSEELLYDRKEKRQRLNSNDQWLDIPGMYYMTTVFKARRKLEVLDISNFFPTSVFNSMKGILY